VPAPAPQRDLRSHAYENPRPEVQALVPAGARRVLDLGCSSGALGAALKARQDVEVVGVELDAVFAAGAGAVLDRVIEADLETFFSGPVAAGLGRFDCVIAADVLEHLSEPEAVLAAAVEHLEPGGTVVVSLPNIRYWHTFWALGVQGTWPRHDCGIFDRTHLRFFALRDAYALLHDAGLAVARVSRQYRVRPWDLPRARPGVLGLPVLRAFFAFQYVIAATRR
jgi:methionine biosynthesis protein MetW